MSSMFSVPRERLLAGCDPEQVVAITTADQPLCILAPAGSGKTRVLTRRIAWRVLEETALASHVLTLTFTRKAAGELRGRLKALGLPEGVTAGTFHAIALSELRRLAAERRDSPPVVLGSKARLLHAVLANERGHPRDPNRSRLMVHEVAGEIEWAKARLVGPGGYELAAGRAGRRPRTPLGTIASMYSSYEHERRRRRVLDFEDLLTTCADELERDPEFAASARWRFRHIFVDEYQDVNDAQVRLLTAWNAGSDDVCVVGDPDQAIYAWNGSDPDAIGHFGSQFRGATVIGLRTNYRSTGEVLGVASAILANQPPPAAGPVPEGSIPLITTYDSDEDEASGVVALARRSHRPGRKWSQIAVLARTNAQLPAFKHAFERRGVPARVVGETGLLRRPHVSAVLSKLYASDDREALARAMADLRSVSTDEASTDAEGSHDEDVPGSPGPLQVSDAAESYTPEERDDLATIASIVADYLRTDVVASGGGLRAFLETAARGEDAGWRRDAVELLTFHRAKGLEWPVVFVTGLEEGLVPIAHAKDEAGLAEERRLLYVACTRAQEELYCSWAESRRLGERTSARAPSPHLEAIEHARRRLQSLASPPGEAARRAIAESRRALAGEP